MPDHIERRIDQAQQIGRLAGILESVEKMVTRIDARVDGLDAKFDGVSEILAVHLRDDAIMRSDVNSHQKFINGENGLPGARKQLEDISKKGYAIMCIASLLGIIGGGITAIGLKPLGEFISRLAG